MEAIIKRAEELKEEIVTWRRYIHQNAEVGFELPKTTAYVKGQLEKMGYEVQEVCQSGLMAVLEGKEKGKTVLLRADMDALPMAEDSDLPFKSLNPETAHTCGHDTHTAMLLGGAKLLMENKDKIKGTVKMIFQPAEEIGLGALKMIEKGVLEDPKVDMAFGIHQVVTREGLDTGKICYAPGPAMASADIFKIKVLGKGAHGAAPEMGVDPINILCHIHTLLQSISTRETPSQSPVVLTIGSIAAGEAANIIPHEGLMRGTVRTFDQNVREMVKGRIKEIAESTALMLGGKCEIEFLTGMAPLINDIQIGKQLEGYFKEAFGVENITTIPAVMGSEDFSYYLLEVPGAFFRISLGSKEEGYLYNSHHPKADFNEGGLPVGAAAYAIAALKWLENN